MFKILTACPRCGSEMIQLDTQLAADAELHGVLNTAPMRYYCWGCHHSSYTFIPEGIPDEPEEKVCENCKLPLEKGRRRFCSERCARPTRLQQQAINEEVENRKRAREVRDILDEHAQDDL